MAIPLVALIEPSVGSMATGYETARGEPLTASTRPRSFAGVSRGAPSTPSNSLRWNGLTGSKIADCWTIGDIPPPEAEERCYAMLHEPAMAA
jgi:hypothetical protein